MAATSIILARGVGVSRPTVFARPHRITPGFHGGLVRSGLEMVTVMETAWSFVTENIWAILFVLWGLPLGIYRSRFRKIVYQTDSWTINIRPYFWRETRALVGNIYPEDMAYIRLRNFYRLYLGIYTLLFALWCGLR